MNNSISNRSGVWIVVIIALLPLFGFFTNTILHKSPQPFFVYLSFICLFLMKFEGRILKIPNYLLFYGLFTLYTLASDILIVGQSFSMELFRNNRFLGSFLLLLIIENLHFNKYYQKRLFQLLLLNIIATFIVIILQKFYNSEFFVIPGFNISLDTGNIDRLVAIYSWIDDRMAFGLVFLPILLIILELAFKRNNAKYIFLLYVGGLIIVFFNKSRITIIQFLPILFLIPIYYGFNLKTLVNVILIGSSVLFFSYYGLTKANVDVDETINNRYLDKNAQSLETSSAGGRIIAWSIFADLFPKNPILGKGKFFNSGVGKDVQLERSLAGRSYQLHVGYLSLFYYYGIIGGGLYMIFLIILSKKFYLDAKRTTYWAPFLGWLMFIYNNFTDVFLHIDFMGILLLIVFNVIYLHEADEEEKIAILSEN